MRWAAKLVAAGISVGVIYLLGRWSHSIDPDLTIGNAVFEWVVLMAFGLVAAALGGLLIGGLINAVVQILMGLTWEKWSRRPASPIAAWWITKSSQAIGAVWGVRYLVEEVGSAPSVASRLRTGAVIAVVIGYLGLAYGLYRISRWVGQNSFLMPEIGILVHEPSEDFWSPQPVRAWRMWRTSSSGLIGAFGDHWGSPDKTAKCVKFWHKAPEWRCTCGIYGLRERPESSLATEVIGLVELRGRVIEHEDGYRAEKAKVIQLWAGTYRSSQRLKELATIRAQMPGVTIQEGHPTIEDVEQGRD